MRFRTNLFLLFLMILSSGSVLIAQVTGSITGTVRDSSGAVIPGAKVTVSNAEHGIHRNAVSNSAGDYLVQGLGEGTYTVSVSAPGFEKYVASNTVIRVGQNARVDAKLSIGSQSTEVTVQGSSAGNSRDAELRAVNDDHIGPDQPT